jgi:hypothetical protein
MTPMMSNRAGQRGVIFLALVLVLFVTGSTLMLGAVNNRQSTTLAQQAELHYQMEQAKTALLAHAASTAGLYNNARGPGFFPCPDTDNDGAAESACNVDDLDNAQLGRLPEYDDNSGTTFRFNDAYAGMSSVHAISITILPANAEAVPELLRTPVLPLMPRMQRITG